MSPLEAAVLFCGFYYAVSVAIGILVGLSR